MNRQTVRLTFPKIYIFRNRKKNKQNPSLNTIYSGKKILTNPNISISRIFSAVCLHSPAGTSSATLGANTEVAVTIAQIESAPPWRFTTSSILYRGKKQNNYNHNKYRDFFIIKNRQTILYFWTLFLPTQTNRR